MRKHFVALVAADRAPARPPLVNTASNVQEISTAADQFRCGLLQRFAPRRQIVRAMAIMMWAGSSSG